MSTCRKVRVGVGAAWLLAAGLLGAAPVRAGAQQQSLRAEWSRNATEYRGQAGRRVTVLCPPQGQLAEVWGTDEYTDDSAVCSAAAHAGAITPASGGAVTIVIATGRSAFPGSTRNGVTSKSFGQFDGSFTIAPSSDVGRIDWRTAAQGLTTDFAQALTLECPPGGLVQSVWGTDVYTDDSSICSAAVHAGLITTARGGRVTLQPVGAQQAFSASSRNGVQTRDFASWPNAFRFAGTSTVAATTATSPTATAPSAGVATAPTASAPTAIAPTGSVTTATTTRTMATATTSALSPTTTMAAPVSSGRTATMSGTTVATSPIASSGAVLASSPPTSTRGGSIASSLPAIVAPTNVRAQALYYRGTVMVSWDTMPGATGYQILARLANGTYAGAMPSGVNEYGPERSQGITMELAYNAPITLVVVANYPQGSSTPSAPVTVSIPRWYGNYRVSVLGFKVDRETKDDPFETDGKRDEVYLRAAAAERGPTGNQYGGVTQLQTLVHGDINTTEWRSATHPNRRMKAGSASVDGGLKTGDGFPSSSPWQRTTSSSYTNTFPLKVWEGTLVQGYNSVQMAFNLWESDQRPGQSVPSYSSFSPEATALSSAAPATTRLQPTTAGKVLAGTIAGVVLAPTLAPLLVLSAPALVPTVAIAMVAAQVTPQLPVVPKVSTPLDGLNDALGLTAAQMAIDNALDGAKNAVLMGASNYVNDFESNLSLAFNAKDHPIGVRKDAQGRLFAMPSMLTLNFENAESEALAGNGPAGKGPGIYAYTLTDQASDPATGMGGDGIYTVYVQVERVN